MADVDHHLRRQVDQVNRLVLQLGEQVHAVSGQVCAVDAAQKQTIADLKALYNEFQAFVRKSQLIANAERAETRVGVVRDRIDHKFGHHKVVRRTAVGMLQAFDVGLVTEQTVQQVSEQLMIQTPGYWLAPALVALAAWSGDDRSLCDRAVAEAFRRSPSRTSLFFALVLRRQSRRDTSLRWLRHYLLAQDPAALGREFAVILESISQGAFAAGGRELLSTTLDGWHRTLLDDDEVTHAQTRRWYAEIESLRGPFAAPQFPRLSTMSPQWAQLDRALCSAGSHQALLDKYTAMMTDDIQPSDRLEDTVDDILDRLVSEYDNDELPLRRELAYNQAVIAHDGDEDAARRAVDVDAASLGENLDYLTVQSTAALNPSAIGASSATQRFSVAACHEWFAQAHLLFSRDYRGAVPPEVQAHVNADLTVDSGGRQFSLPPWTGSFNTPLEQLERSLSDHWELHMGPYLDSLAYPLMKQLALLSATIAGILLFLGGVRDEFAFLASLFVGGIWGAVIYNRFHAARKGQQSARQFLEHHQRESMLRLRGASAELTDWQDQYRAADALEPKARAFIQSLSTATAAAAPFEGRIVDNEESMRAS